MTNGAGQAAACRNPACPNLVEQSSGSGRPRKYCSDECRKSFYKAHHNLPSPEAERHDVYVRQIADDLFHKAERLRNLAHADRTGLALTDPTSLRFLSLALLQSSEELAKEVKDLDAAIVQQARDRGLKVNDIAKARNISPDKVSRDWPTDSIDRRMKQRQQRGRTGTLRTSVDVPGPGVLDDCRFLPGQYLPGEMPDPDLPAYELDSTEGPPGRRAQAGPCSRPPRLQSASGVHAAGESRSSFLQQVGGLPVSCSTDHRGLVAVGGQAA
ncbi:hypothetical protein [Streptomyces netropsis]|uniref:Uncharacterized protein n=1 Tax=Streptomyces netropsis TaxID=55404 RepID=A0A7W7PHU6_STRNE|nr:hypothetical protein [Streptomyces netropsis]MBB4890434.1 hypothetical protein [Streptomyces netropsis]